MSKEKKSLLVFYGITLAASLIFDLLYIFTGFSLLVSISMWIPGITGIVCSKVFFKNRYLIGIRRKVKPVYIILSIVIPLLYLVPEYVLAWAVLKDPTTGIDNLPAVVLGESGAGIPGGIYIAVSFIPMLLSSVLTAAGEEIGWRGFAYPVLEKEFGQVKAVIINGLLWAAWHLPLIFGGVYQSNVNIVYGIISFFVMVMLMTVIFCWTRSVSGSLIPAILLHAVHNELDQIYLQPLSSNSKVPYFAGEQGMFTIAVTAMIAVCVIVVWKKQKASLEQSLGTEVF
ncbi:MAG: CPBP family intramembrane metalloprotease [Lachnospiraceae bacterium]|nr:CPBP family intramembrane metalloprotease [Lachnospiraceae bacterium]